MAYITEHHSKQEWERHDREHRWVYFFVGGDSVGIDNLLEGPSEVVDLEMSGRLDSMLVLLDTPGRCEGAQVLEDVLLVVARRPEISDVHRSTLFELVQRVEERLLLGHVPSENF